MSDVKDAKPRRAWLAFLPVLAFVALVGVFAYLLGQDGRDTSALPSTLIDRAAPDMSLPPLEGLTDLAGKPLPGIDPAVFQGKISLVNVFASWCAPCRQEHPFLMALASDERLQIIGLNYKDKAANATAFLSELGNPYDAVGVDSNGRGGIEWGVYGVPETFLIGPDGLIRYKFTGPLDAQSVAEQLMPEIEKIAPRT